MADETRRSSASRAEEPAGFLGRLVGSFRRRPPTAASDEARRLIGLCRALLSERAEISGAAIANDLLARYAALDGRGRAAFFDLLVSEFSPNPEQVVRAAEAYRAQPSQANLIRLQRAADTPRQELFRRVTSASDGIAAVVRMRRDLLRELDQNPEWSGIDADLMTLFRSWFSRAFLELRQIDWRTAAVVLEKLIEYEAVHQIQGWRDLRRRLQADRRCYGFFHHALPDEPIIFIEVALTRGLTAEVQPLLDPDSAVFDARNADHAIFYSITNCQEGLRGVSFGNLLIKQVAEHLRKELSGLKTFATLSPVPGFRKWLTDVAASDGRPELRHLVAELEKPGWWEQPATAARLKTDLVPLCAHYLLHATRRREPLDPVARFHLGNGARLERVNWLANTSPAGLNRSAGLTVNYVYDLSEVERNHAAYSRDFTVVASNRFERVARKAILREPARPAPARDAAPLKEPA
jgi:malonyl-CoA decarboxylase